MSVDETHENRTRNTKPIIFGQTNSAAKISNSRSPKSGNHQTPSGYQQRHRRTRSLQAMQPGPILSDADETNQIVAEASRFLKFRINSGTCVVDTLFVLFNINININVNL